MKINNTFLRGVIFVAGGTAFAQIINTLATPIVTRIYTPEEYGVLTIFTTVLGLLAFGGYKLEMGIPISNSDKNAANVTFLSMFALFTHAILLLILFILWHDELLVFFKIEPLDHYIYLLPLGVALLGLYQIFKQWAYRNKDFKIIAKTTIKQSVVGSISNIILGLSGLGVAGLIFGNILKESLGAYNIAKKYFSSYFFKLKYIKWTEILSSFIRFKDFPLYNFPAHILNSLSIKVPILFLSIIYGPQVVGYFGLASTVVRIPLRLIGTSVGDVFYSEAASIGRSDPSKLKNLSQLLMRKLIFAGSIPVLVLIFFAPELFSLVFGSQWSKAGVFASICAIMIFFTLIFAPLSRIYEIFEKQKLKILIDILKSIAIAILFLAAWLMQFDEYLTIFMYSILMSIYQLTLYFFAQKILGEKIKEINRDGEL
ncbi:oligosaccharide flippase family protein [Paenibacillus sp. IB182496]|uniref:Oligosaccharide flippase family protein n=1 Tax=Paenibacillus sabuli TaxID=2772509 RepID=A0A927BY50_9BACL|nr:oligosaccharide flippase family protein [Paenibacillus sabuli]MBD2847554.1 oligosaccharide flippase family protein [Paenibacillus sabuli]